MILLDANLLLYAYVNDFPQHAAAKTWLEETLQSGDEIGLSWQVITAFVRIGTNPKVFAKPMTIEQVESKLGKLLAYPKVKVIVPTSNHWQIFIKLLKDANLRADLVMDAHLAALAIEYNARIASTDKDFRLFTNLNHFNPLEEN